MTHSVGYYHQSAPRKLNVLGHHVYINVYLAKLLVIDDIF